MVVRLSALRTGRIYPQGNALGTYFCYRLSRPQWPKCDRKDYANTNTGLNWPRVFQEVRFLRFHKNGTEWW